MSTANTHIIEWDIGASAVLVAGRDHQGHGLVDVVGEGEHVRGRTA